MSKIEDIKQKKFIKQFPGYNTEITKQVAEIICNVWETGDDALSEYTEKFDGFTKKSFRVSQEEIAKAKDSLSSDVRGALEFAAERIRAFHEKQLPENERFSDSLNVEMGSLWSPVERVGIYVPGGTASYPSSVLMNAIPAQIAGVKNIAMATPAPKGVLNQTILGAAGLVGIEEIYCIGGAQAIAALTFGTKSIASVDVIVGPGNAYVAEAKKQVTGLVGIDMIAGPSEIVIVADDSNNPEWVAADLLAQAEHDENAEAILCTDNEDFAKKVEAEVDKQLAELPREMIAKASWNNHGAIFLFDNLMEQVPSYINFLSPEHLHLALSEDKAEKLLSKIRNAGAIFIGPYTPEVIGDYVGGPNHVLPTTNTSRFSSGLSVLNFMKRSSVLKCDAESFAKLAPYAEILAQAEGLSAHALAVTLRRKK